MIEWLTFLFVKSEERGGHWGILETAKPRKKSSKTAKPAKNSAKTENLTYSQNRKTQKQHWIIKPKNRYYFLRKPNAKNRKSRKPQRTPKPKSFITLKNSQNRKSQCPPQERLVMHEIMGNSRNHVSCTKDLEITHAFKKLKKSKLFENLNDAYVISMPKFAIWK